MLGTFVDAPLQTLGQFDQHPDPVRHPVQVPGRYNYLIFGIILVLMMIYRPEGLLPTEARKAELHGEGIAADQTFGTESTVAEAATEYEEQVTEDPTPDVAGDEPQARPSTRARRPGHPKTRPKDLR